MLNTARTKLLNGKTTPEQDSLLMKINGAKKEFSRQWDEWEKLEAEWQAIVDDPATTDEERSMIEDKRKKIDETREKWNMRYKQLESEYIEKFGERSDETMKRINPGHSQERLFA